MQQMMLKCLSYGDVMLRPLSNAEADALAALASDKKIWGVAPYPYDIPSVFKEKWFNKTMQQVAAGERICFVVFAAGKTVGSTSYYHIDLDNKKIAIGYTWFTPAVWGSHVNAITKLILLEYAFDVLALNRVEFFVDSLNERSCRALEKLGVTREGVLRNHLVMPSGRIRHSVVFSVIREEWSEVKARITRRLLDTK